MDRKVVRNAASESARPKRDEVVIFSIVRDSVCAECGSELGRGRFIRIEGERALCLACADLDSSGDQAASLRKELYRLTRRRRRLPLGDVEYEIRARVYDSFGEDAFRVELRRI